MPKLISAHIFTSILFLIALFCFSSCSENNKQKENKTAKQDNIVAPQVTLLANLPDSLKPKQTFLENVPKPLSVIVPNKAGGSYTDQTRSEPQLLMDGPMRLWYSLM